MKKRLISILLTLLMVMSLFSGMSVSAYADDGTEDLYVEYTLAQGDYVLRICQKLGINYYTCKEAIMALNNITSENGFRYLSVGEVVKIPVSDAAAIAIMTGEKPSSTGSTGGTASGTVSSGATIAYYLIPYTMQRGETVLGVCNSLGISFANYADQIMKLNGISSWNKVNAGTTLLLPSTKTPAVGTTCYAVVAHKVASGDTVYNLSQKYGVNYGSSTKLLQALNNTNNLAAIKAGKNFYLPVATTIKAQSSTTTGTTTGSSTTTGTTTGSTTTDTAAKSYDITANINTNYGSVAFYVNNASVSSAKEGDVVTVNVTTKDNKAVESLVVKYADGRADVKLEANSFIMPACDVRVDANIKAGNSITINSNYSFKTAAQVGGVNVSSASTGSSVKIVSTDPGFAVKEVEAYYSTLWGMKKEVISVNDQFCFTMPNKDVTVNVTLAPVTTYSFFRADPDHGSFDIQVDGNSVSKAAKGSKVTVLWQAMSGWDISEINVYKADNNGKYDVADKLNVFNNSFTMPGSPVYVEVKFECTTNFISLDAVEGGKLVAKVGGDVADEAETNEEVIISAEVSAAGTAAGYMNQIKELVITRKADGHRVSVSDMGDGTFKFKMPAGGVDVSGKLASVENNTVSVYFNATGSENRVTLKAEGYENWAVIDNESGASREYAVGTRISLSTLARDSHAFTKYMVYTGDAKTFDQEMTDMANEQGLIIMPNTKVILEAYFSAGEIAIGEAKVSGNGTVSYQVDNGSGFKAANSCKVGDTVKIIAKYNFSGIISTKDTITVINNETGKALQLTDDLCFQMPAGGVTITADFVGKDHTLELVVVDVNGNDLGKESMMGVAVNDAQAVIVNQAGGITLDVQAGDKLVFAMTNAGKKDYTIDSVKIEGLHTGDPHEGGLTYDLGEFQVGMWDEDVRITVYLKLKQSQTYSLNNLSWNVKRGDVDCAVGYKDSKIVTTGNAGDIITVITDVLAPYSVNAESLTLTRNSDGGQFTLGKNDPAVDEIGAGKIYPFTDASGKQCWMYIMPEGGVTGHVSFEAAESDIILTVKDTAGNVLTGEGLVIISADGNDKQYNVSGVVEKVAYGSNVNVSLSTAGAQNYKLKTVAAEGVQVRNNSFTMPETSINVEITLESKIVEASTIKLNTAADKNGAVQYYLDAACTQLITDAKAAVGADIYAKVIPNSGYVLQADIAIKNNFDNTTVAATQISSDLWKFTAPEHDVTLTASFVKEVYLMTVYVGGGTGTDVKATVEKTGITNLVKDGDVLEVPYNTNVTFAVADTNAYIMTGATASAGTMKNVSKTGANITMPACDMYVDITLAAK